MSVEQGHPKLAAKFVADTERMHWHDQALWYIREKRDLGSKSVDEWEDLRELAKQIKTHTMDKLDFYLEKFEKNAKANGIIVHWAKDAKEHNEIVHKILSEKNVTKLVKSKSMLTQECDLNPYLEERGIEVVDTDLGERIVQLRDEPPSHPVLPAIHLKKEEVGKTFEKFFDSEKDNSDPTYLTLVARKALRIKFLNSQAAMTGANFGIAETGGIVVCTNEGNADLGVSLSKLHIACMGIEKLIPRLEDLSVFTRLLARSGTGQPITAYTAHHHSPCKGGEMHIVIVDNGRSAILAQQDFKRSLNCIRCGACMNTCPVYRRSGGYSYESLIPGPIGSILGPSRNPKQYKTLPAACTLCASCTNVCPVKIDLHEQLYKHRQTVVNTGNLDSKKLTILKFATWVLKYPTLLAFGGKMARIMVPLLPRSIVYSKMNVWGKKRELPPFPKNSFKELYKQRKGGK
jgi:L-lactate dehydrogenase complex protein LldF